MEYAHKAKAMQQIYNFLHKLDVDAFVEKVTKKKGPEEDTEESSEEKEKRERQDAETLPDKPIKKPGG